MTAVEARAAAIAVCPLEALDVERGAAALVDGRQVALFRLADGTVHAIDNRDPATGVQVLARGLLGTAGDEWYVASPLHKHRFSLADGHHLGGRDDLRVAVHRVEVVDGTVNVTLTPPS